MEHKHIVVEQPIWQKLKDRAKPHQAVAGVIEELLALADRYSPLPKVPEPPKQEETMSSQ